jgi:hypothetical protein
MTAQVFIYLLIVSSHLLLWHGIGRVTSARYNRYWPNSPYLISLAFSGKNPSATHRRLFVNYRCILIHFFVVHQKGFRRTNRPNTMDVYAAHLLCILSGLRCLRHRVTQRRTACLMRRERLFLIMVRVILRHELF